MGAGILVLVEPIGVAGPVKGLGLEIGLLNAEVRFGCGVSAACLPELRPSLLFGDLEDEDPRLR